MERVREGFDRAVLRRARRGRRVLACGPTASPGPTPRWSTRSWAAALVPGPLVWCFGRDAHHRPASTARVAGAALRRVPRPRRSTCVVLGDRRGRGGRRPTLESPAVAAEWPLDPLTPVWRVDAIATATRRRGRGPDRGSPCASGALLTAAYCVGMADRLDELAVAYAQERQQFDRPIGSFQAVKHICADMAVRAELARVATHAAACVLDDPDDGRRSTARSAAPSCSPVKPRS